MGGEKLPDLTATGISLPILRFALATVTSVVVHLALLCVPIFGGDVVWFVSQGAVSSRLDGRLKVELAHGAIQNRSSAPLPAGRIAPNSNQTESPSFKAGVGLLSASKPDRSPVLLSEIDGAVDSWGIKGKMILHLEVEASGDVRFSEVIYSELPDAVGQELRRRFAAAKFQPALRNDRAVDASLLLRVDVD